MLEINSYIFYLIKIDMESKIYSTIVISYILAFALITTAGKIPTVFEKVLAQSWDIDETPGGSGLGNDTGTTGWSDLDENTTESQPQEDKNTE
jgi:hypothetical protein